MIHKLDKYIYYNKIIKINLVYNKYTLVTTD